MVEELREVIKKRAGLSEEQEEEIRECQAQEVSLLTQDTTRTIHFLLQECTQEEYSWIFEVFEEVAGRTSSKAFVECLPKLAKKYPQTTEEYGIDEVIEYATGNVLELPGWDA